jgi:hypothetical protein
MSPLLSNNESLISTARFHISLINQRRYKDQYKESTYQNNEFVVNCISIRKAFINNPIFTTTKFRCQFN